MIQPVESLEITVLVDNGTDSLSTNPGFVETEMAGAWRRGMKWLSGLCLPRRPWPVLPDHHPDPVVTTYASVRHGPGRVHLRSGMSSGLASIWAASMR